MTTPLAIVDSVSAFIPGTMPRKLALRDISLILHAGGHLRVRGENGSGKSSLLRLLHGDIMPCSGKLCWQGESGSLESSRMTARSRAALVSPMAQENIIRSSFNLSVADWLVRDDALDPFSLGLDREQLQERAAEWFARLDGLCLWQRPLNALSQGQLRLCLLARALLREPALLFLDEYADGLDDRHAKRAMDCLSMVKDSVTMVFVSHREDRIPPWCGINMKMSAGRLLLAEPAPPRPRKGPIPDAPLRKMAGKALFQLSNASVYVEGKLTLKNINWQCAAGEHWFIKGENGSGKSTFLRLLAGDEQVASGGFLKMWRPDSGEPVKSLMEKRRLISLVSDFGQASYPYDLSGLELVCSGFDNSMGIYREFSANELREAREAIAFFFPDTDPNQIAAASIRRLSSGQLRRLYLARALTGNPCVLLMDEPFSLLDCSSREKTARLLQQLGVNGWRKHKLSLIFVSHYPDDVPPCVGRAAEMRNGELKTLC